jgi:multidrug efflux pump subunit AcrA (membrane-fusion protein)
VPTSPIPESPSSASRADGGESVPTRPPTIFRHRRTAPTAGVDGQGPVTATVPHARRRWQGRSRLAKAAGAVVLLGTVGGLLVANRGSSAEAGYRTTTVGAHPVDQELDRVGTVEPVAQASVNFPVDGTVRSVDVTVGDQVTVGQQLARLDTASLDAAVADAQAALDAAELTLERALNGEDVSSAGAAPGAATPAGASTTDSNIATLVAYTTTAARTDDPELAAAQQAVLDAQRQVDTDLANAQQALDDARSICASLTAPPEPAAQPDTTSTPDATDAGVAPSDPDSTDPVAA